MIEEFNNKVSVGRKRAQIKSKLKDVNCEHPENSLVMLLLLDDGFIEYCADCMRVVDLFNGNY